MQHGIKPFPPFGAILHQIKLAKITLQYAVHVYVGRHAWCDAKSNIERGQIAICLPADTHPDDFFWPVANLNLIIDDTGSSNLQQLIALAECLIRNRAKVVYVYSTLCPQGLYFTST